MTQLFAAILFPCIEWGGAFNQAMRENMKTLLVLQSHSFAVFSGRDIFEPETGFSQKKAMCSVLLS